MEKIREFQGILLRYFKFGNSEDEAKVKVKKFSEDLTFLGIPIRDNIDNIMANPNAYTLLIQFSDLNYISSIREHIEDIKFKHNHYSEQSPVDKAEFASQYIQFLTGVFKSQEKARSVLKLLGEQMKELGCPIGDNLTGYVMESNRLHKLMTLSSMNVISKILEQVKIIKEG